MPGKAKKRVGAKTATARSTRAKSKETVAPSRRSTRATSNEPLLSLDDPNKILRKARKTPEVQEQPIEVETQVEVEVEVEDDLEVEDEVVMEGIEVEEPSSPIAPSPIMEEEPHLYNQHLSPVREETTSEIAHFFSPLFPKAPVQQTSINVPARVGITFNSYFDVFDHLHKLLARETPAATHEARQIIETERDLHAQALIASSPPTQNSIASSPPAAAIRQVSPTSSVFHAPSEAQPTPQGGILSYVASPFRLIATPVSKIGRLFGRGAMTEPAQRVAPAPTLNRPTTPTSSRTQVAYTPQAHSSPTSDNFLADASPSISHASNKRDSAVTPQQAVTSQTKNTNHNTPISITHLDDGTLIPTAFRSWGGHSRQRQQKSMEDVRKMLAEVASGDRVLTNGELKWVEKIQKQQRFLDHWRARQPGHRKMANAAAAAISSPLLHTTTPVAGRKRAADDVVETTEVQQETPDSKRRRTFTTSIGYSSPIPGDSDYHHVNQERGTTTNASGSPEPTERTRGWSVAVPDDSDDEEMPLVKPNPPNWIGLPDDFYDYSSSDEEDEPARGSNPTPFTHKYTPAKPSGLRTVEVASSPVAAVAPAGPSPPISPDFDMSFFIKATEDYIKAQAPVSEDLPHIEVDPLAGLMEAEYRKLLISYNA